MHILILILLHRLKEGTEKKCYIELFFKYTNLCTWKVLRSGAKNRFTLFNEFALNKIRNISTDF